MRVLLATDHGGFEMKEAIKRHLQSREIAVEDCGAFSYDPHDDYPDYIIPMAERVAASPGAFGIALGRSGNGEAIAANKVQGIRCVLCTNEAMARKGREHNDANVLALGGDYLTLDQAIQLTDVFLATDFSGEGRHARRIEKMSEYEASIRK